MRTELAVESLKVHLQHALDACVNTHLSTMPRVEQLVATAPLRHLVYGLQRVGCPIVMKRTNAGTYEIE